MVGGYYVCGRGGGGGDGQGEEGEVLKERMIVVIIKGLG